MSARRFLPILIVVPAFAATPLDYGRDIRPILSENCFHCHGQDAQKRMAGLRLDTFEGAQAKNALVPGQPEASMLYQRITSENKARRMPPVGSGRSLTAEQIATLKRWIAEGGKYAQHWSFVPPVRPSVPAGQEPIAHLVSARLQHQGLSLSAPASPVAWLRRVTLDLTGLPPTPAELDAFLAEPNYEKTVDRLLASPRYGERMAMDWLDVARYADTHGFNNDAAREMWRWRDWVIDAFNRNQPYDRFLTEQLAGDLLPNPTLEQRIATGFGRNHVINSEGGIIEEEYRVEYVADRVRTLGMAWLGLTVECSRCHDHKYDPITQKDHYQLFAFFNNVPELGEDGRVANAVPLLRAPTAAQQAKLAQLDLAIAEAQKDVAAREKRWRFHAGRLPALPAAVEGAVATAALPGDAKETAPVPVGTRSPLSFAFWLAPTAADRDVALFSSVDYARSMASVRYGAGLELRLVEGELEFRYGQRFPAYAMRLRSEGAALAAGERRHLTLVYTGEAPEPGALRAPASWVRMYVDGREVPVRLLNDGAPSTKTDKASPTKLRLGWDNAPGSAKLAGQLSDAGIWNRALTPDEIYRHFARRALVVKGTPTPRELTWLRAADLRARDARYASAERTLLDRQAERLALLRAMPTAMVMEEMNPPRQTHLLKRGQYDQPGEKLEPAVPEQLLGAWPAGAPRNRLGLAQWLTQPSHPLTARVVVNRFWQQLFGQGLVKTSENFGVQGEFPSHPDVLDWLAREFVDSGWNVKALMKRLVLSPVYRQDSAASKELIARDPENRLLARGPRVRLPAEAIRDQALFIAGLLSERVGGPSVFPYQPAGLYKGIVVAADYPGTNYTPSQGGDLYRRSLYTFWKRTVPHPTMTVFDAPDREFCIVRRSSTNTPLQALTLLNDPIFVEAARKLAERVIKEGGATPASRLALAFRLATGRAPDGDELAILTRTLEGAKAAYQANEQGARELLATGSAPIESTLSAAELAAYTAATSVILNLDETITKG